MWQWILGGCMYIYMLLLLHKLVMVLDTEDDVSSADLLSCAACKYHDSFFLI